MYLIYPINSKNFFRVGQLTFDFLFIGHVARREALDRNRDERVASMRWTQGPPDQERRKWLNKNLSDSSQPLISRIITAEITSDRWTPE